MSNMTYLDALEYALESEMAAHDELILFRPGAKPVFDADGRELALPRLGASSFSVALGAALCGMHAVLDMRQEPNAAELLETALSALPEGMSPEITILLHSDGAEGLSRKSGIRLLAPATPRQAAGLTRGALRQRQMTLLAVDQALYGAEDDVPEDDDFVLLPPEEEACELRETVCEAEEEAGEPRETVCEAEEGACEPRETVCEAEEETVESFETVCEAEEETVESFETVCEAEEETVESCETVCEAEKEACEPREVVCEPAPEADGMPEALRGACILTMRALPVSLQRLFDLADELDMPREALVTRCIAKALSGRRAVEWRYEPEALDGECAYDSATAGASIWLGSDRMTICCAGDDAEREEAARLLRAAKRVLERPTLLIYDKEADER